MEGEAGLVVGSGPSRPRDSDAESCRSRNSTHSSSWTSTSIDLAPRQECRVFSPTISFHYEALLDG